jgi:hypothetical protein
VSGVVTANGAPVAGARVAVLEQVFDSVTVTDAEGRYSVRAVQAQPWGLSPLVSASRAGYFADIRFTDANYLPISKDMQLDFVLEPLTFIPLGETVSARIGSATCAHWGYGAGACGRMAVTPPTSGTLVVTVEGKTDFDIDVVNPNGTFAAYDPFPHPPLHTLRVPVTGGSTYQIRLAGAPRDVNLTASLQ